MDARALIVVVLAACAGPQPRVENAAAMPSPQPGATRVTLDIVNRGGEGSIDLQIELRDPGGRRIRADRTLEVERDESFHYETDIETPPGTYTVKASASYPD
jgi:hypothetical protein